MVYAILKAILVVSPYLLRVCHQFVTCKYYWYIIHSNTYSNNSYLYHCNIVSNLFCNRREIRNEMVQCFSSFTFQVCQHLH